MSEQRHDPYQLPSTRDSRVEHKNSSVKELTASLTRKINDLEQEKQTDKNRIRTLELRLSECEQKLKQEPDDKLIAEKAREMLKPVFTQNQLDKLTGQKRRVNWTNQELSTGYTLRYFSAAGYDYLTKELKYPLPRPSCLREYASKMDMRQGFLYDSLAMLKIAAPNLTERDRASVMLYDEMSTRELYEYDRKHDDVLEPHKKAQV